jgi:H+-transporting ATPase
MSTITGKPAVGNGKVPDIAAMSVPDTLSALHVNPDTGLTHAKVEVCRKEHGYNEVNNGSGSASPFNVSH